MAETRRIGGHAWDKATSILKVWIDGQVHTYSNVSYYWWEKFEFAATKNFGRAMTILRKLHEEKGE